MEKYQIVLPDYRMVGSDRVRFLGIDSWASLKVYKFGLSITRVTTDKALFRTHL
jgi:hypothetical protein